MAQSIQLSDRQVVVGRSLSGLRGLDEIFESLYEIGETPEDELGPRLVARAREHNYIPASAEKAFAAALLREYRTFLKERQSGREPESDGDTWRGIPREQIPWFPSLDESLCDGCEKCLDFCSRGVYAQRGGGTVCVAQPLQCQVGCSACARLCPRRAISFPPAATLQTLLGRR